MIVSRVSTPEGKGEAVENEGYKVSVCQQSAVDGAQHTTAHAARMLVRHGGELEKVAGDDELKTAEGATIPAQEFPEK